jgi:transposase-like protein
MNTRGVAAERWRGILRRHRASGLSVAAFCRRAGVSPVSFYAWRRKLGKETAFVEVKVAGEASPVPTADGIELRLPGRRCLVVRRGFDRQALVDLLHVLEEDASDSSSWKGMA